MQFVHNRNLSKSYANGNIFSNALNQKSIQKTSKMFHRCIVKISDTRFCIVFWNKRIILVTLKQFGLYRRFLVSKEKLVFLVRNSGEFRRPKCS